MNAFNTLLPSTYDLRLVAVSYLVAVLASYAALDLAGQVTATHGRARQLWLVGGAVTMGLGIWTMHFIGMLAFQIGMQVTYTLPLVITSLLIAIAAAGFALVIASRPTLTIRPLLAGGLCLGLGIAAMHYTGMAAMDLDGTIQYQPLLVGLSLLIAISAAVAALWLAFHLRHAHGTATAWRVRKLGSAGVMGAAIAGMHYTGMAAVGITTTHADHVMAAETTTPFTLAIALGIATLVILGCTLLSAVVDRRFATQTATFESLFVHSTDAIMALAVDGTLRRANPAAAQLAGSPLTAGSTHILRTLLDPADQERLTTQIHTAAQGRSQYGDYTLVQPTGQRVITAATMVPIIVSEQISGVYGIFRDITARRQAEDALTAQRDHYAQVLRSLSDLGEGMVVVEAGQIVFANDALCQISGYQPDELQTIESLRMLIAPEDEDPTAQPITDLYTGTWNGGRVEGVLKHKDGHRVPIESASQRVSVDGRTQRLLLLHDITDRKAAEAALATAHADLAQAVQTATASADAADAANRAKSDFLATMSHEIRTPMNAVIGMTGLLLDTQLGTEQREYVETIRTSSDALLTIINDILDFSKIESGKFELEQQPFDLRDCLEAALDLVAARAADQQLDLAYMIAQDVPQALLGDVTRVRQVLVNLLANAVKFTPAGEVVVQIDAQAVSDQQYEVHVAVRDSGIGIPADRMDRLFQAFSQVDASTTRQYGGTGLGLAISWRLCAMMGGRMWVESQVGVGTTFHFTIVAPVASMPARIDLYGSVPELAGKRLLVVDDNATNRRILTLYAEAWGMHVHASVSGAEALDLLAQGSVFDLAILDMQMPEMDGAQLAEVIHTRHATQTLPLVLLTSLGRRAEDMAQGRFAASLTKPVKAAQLHETLRDVLDVTTARQPTLPLRTAYDATMAARLPLRILLAEDNAVNQKVATKTLAKLGYRVDVVANGLEVLDALARQPYDVVLMDVQMPELDGLGASRRIRSEVPPLRQPRIIAMTANAMQSDRGLCLAAGMDDYISKPVRIADMVAALERTPTGATVPDPAAATLALALPTDAVDRTVLDQIQMSLGEGTPTIVVEIIDMFADDLPRQLTALRQGVTAGDAPVVQRIAHTIKASAATIGANTLAALCDTLEALARMNDLRDASAHTAHITATSAAVLTELAAIRPQFAAMGDPIGV